MSEVFLRFRKPIDIDVAAFAVAIGGGVSASARAGEVVFEIDHHGVRGTARLETPEAPAGAAKVRARSISLRRAAAQ